MWYDAVIAGVLVFAMIRGAMKGIVWQLAVIAAIVLCFFFAGSLSQTLAPYIGLEPPLNRWVAMFLLYVGFSFVSFAGARIIREGIEKAKFEAFDRHLGAVFGLVKGGVFALVITFFAATMSESQRSTIFNSYSGQAAAVIMDRLHPVMPAELHEVLEPYIHSLDRPELDLQYTHGRSASADDLAHDHDHDHHSHDPFAHETDPFANESNPSQGGGDYWRDDTATSKNSQGGSSDNQLAAFVDSLDGDGLDSQLRQAILQALKNTDSQDRPELMEKLKTGIPGLLRTLASTWQEGRPDTTSTTADRDNLLREIAAMYFDKPDAQQKHIDKTEQALAGIPDRVALAVLEDWHADLFVADADPDPKTGYDTALDQRIVRQLELAGISMNSLSTSLRNRLKGGSTR